MMTEQRPGARICLSALLLALGGAAGARAETLADAAALAYANNPSLLAQRAAQQAVDETYVQARSRFGPSLQASASETYQKTINNFSRREVHAPNTAITFTQPLYTGARQHAALSAAEAAVLAQRETLRQAEAQLLQTVVSVYVGVRRDERLLGVYRDAVEVLQRQLTQVEAQFRVGEVTQTDVDQTRGRLEIARANVAGSQSQLEISRSQYLQVVGQNPGTLAPEPALETLPTLDQAFDLAEALNPGLNAARYNEQAARARVQQARANYLPSVTAQAQVSRTPYNPGIPVLGNQTVVVGTVTATQPLYTSGLYASVVRQTLAQVEQARAQIEVARRSAVQSVGQAWSQLVAARLALSADERAVTATSAAFFGIQTEYPYGLRSQYEVLNADQELNASQVRLLQDRYTEYVARAAVLAAAGVLDVQTLSPAARPIDPVTSFNRVKNRGIPPWVGLIQALDSIGAPPLRPSRPAVRDPSARNDVQPALPPAPPEAAKLAPMRTASSIMDLAPKPPDQPIRSRAADVAAPK